MDTPVPCILFLTMNLIQARNSKTGELVATVVQLKMASGILGNLLAAKL